MDSQPNPRQKISIRGLSFYFQKKEVIHDLTLDIAEHQILSVFGPAGSGITTLLRALNRLCDLTPGARAEGGILLDGEDINSPAVSVTRLRRRVGMVFDVPTPLPMTVFDNVAYGLRLGGVRDKTLIAQKVEQALRMAALWEDAKDRQHVPAMMLSGGQQQRLCIARVLALSPEVILLDRPCSGLDPISTAKIEDSLRSLKQQFTIVVAPHSIQQAGRISDRVAFMLMGRLIEEGPVQRVFTSPEDPRTNDYLTGRFG